MFEHSLLAAEDLMTRDVAVVRPETSGLIGAMGKELAGD